MSAGSGSDPHMLALLRAMRLRLAAPDAAAAGAADVEAALGAQAAAGEPAEPIHPELLVHPHWPGAADLESAAGQPGPVEPAGEPGEGREVAGSGGFRASLGAVPGGPRPAISSAVPPAIPSSPASPPAPAPGPLGPPPVPAPVPAPGPSGPPPHLSEPIIDGPVPPGTPEPLLPEGPGRPGHPLPLPGTTPRSLPGVHLPLPGTFPPAPAVPLPPTPPAAPLPGTPAPAPAGGSGGVERRSTIPYPPGAGPWIAGLHTGSTQPVGGIPGVSGPRPAGPPWPGDPVLPLTGAGATRPAEIRPGGVLPPAQPRPAQPVDGMNPADDAALHEVRRLLGNSLSLAGGPEEVAQRLRAALLQAEPDLFARIPGGPAAQTEQLAEGLTWLVHTFDQPPALVAGFGRLGAALAECGIVPQQLQLAGAALAEAMRAGLAANGWRQDFDQAWRTTWQHAYEWIAHGMTAAEYHPVTWTAKVVSHERRRDDLAVIRLRPYLPMPYAPGQYARVEVPGLPGVWRPYSLAGAPRRDNVIELHVRAKTLTGVSGTLVHRTAAGDKLRISRAEGEMVLPAAGRDLLMIAGDTGVAPLKALLTELAATGDPRSAVLFWGARTLDELYDIEELTAIASAARRATVVPVISEGPAGPYASGLVTDAVAAYGEWSGHEAYLAGPPIMLAATTAALVQLGVDPERIHHDKPE